MPNSAKPFPQDGSAQTLGRSQHFDAEAIGASLLSLAVDVVKGDTTEFMSRWFKSSSVEADLVIWTDSQKRIIKHQLCFYGQVVDWNPINGTRTGLVVEEEVEESSGDDVAETIRFDKVTQSGAVDQAVRVLSRVPELSEEDRSALIFNLRESIKLHKKARERAIQTWSPKIEELTSTQRPTFWKRLRSWVLGDE
jgi:hypothetical protein